MNAPPILLKMQSDHQQFQHQRELARQCWYLTGATASGKSAVSLLLAERLGAEIVSLDSMAVYQKMDIGTAKPDREAQQRIPHHLIDLVPPTTDFSLSEYVAEAFSKIEELTRQNKPVLFVGGTALYLKSLLRGMFEGPPADWNFRNQIMEELKTVDQLELHKRLAQVDPLSAHKLHPNDTRRIIRALEVYRITGVPISHQQTQFEEGNAPEDYRVFAIGHPREILHQRIDQRIDQMFADGFIEEVKTLKSEFGELGRTASQAVGYKEIIDAFYNDSASNENACPSDLDGEIMEELSNRVKFRTHQFARHQETWFRGLSEIRWIDSQTFTGDEFDDASSTEKVVDYILREAKA